MRFIPTATLLLALAGGVLAASPDEEYLAIYTKIQDADALQKSGQSSVAAARYKEAQDALLKYHMNHPAANVAAVNYRLDYLGDKLKELAASLPSTNAIPAAASAQPFSPLTPQQQAAATLQELTKAYNLLEMKYKEAQSVQPAALAPGELDKAREKIAGLEKDRDLLGVSLDQQRTANAAAAKPAASSAAAATGTNQSAQAEVAGLKHSLEETRQKLSDTEAELNNLKTRPALERPEAGDLQQLAAVTAERDQAKKDLATVSNELVNVSKELGDRVAHANAGAAAPGADAAKLKEVEKERDDLKQQLAAMTPATPSQPAPAAAAASSAELEQLRARLAVLEAAAVPYTAEERAVLKSPTAARLTVPPAAAREPASKVHSVKDLSPGAATIMRDAEMDATTRRYDDAEKKYLQVLQQDENNIYVLAKLGSAEFAAGRLDDCEKNTRRALALDPNDPGALYLLGILRYRQEKLDEAFDALSRSASFNPTNQSTQYFLGCVLADKGLRSEAETALRKALDLDPNFADAHFSLALVYAAQTPPSLEMARFHYQKALDLGHAKNASLDKMLSAAK